MYSCKTSIELPHVIDNEIVGHVPDVDCIVCLDEDGDLWKLILPVWKSDRRITKLSGHEFDAAKEHVEKHKHDLMDRAGVPAPVEEEPEWSGPEYRRVPLNMNLGF